MAGKTESIQLTKEEIVQEILHCSKNPAYFVINYCRITHPKKGLISFKLFDFQEDLLKQFKAQRFNVVLKARQLGISTLIAAYITWLILFKRGKTVLVLATKLSTAANLVKKVKVMFKYLPDFIRISKSITDNMNSLELDNGSWVKAIATSSDAGRSESLSLLIVDEAAHVDGLDELWAAIFPAISLGGSCILSSSPFGVGNLFHKIYTEAEAGLNDFHSTKLLWSVHPERDQAWFDKETKNMSKREIAQELMANFNMSGETVFDPEDIEFLSLNIREPKYKTGVDRNLWIWEQYKAGHNYIISVDVSRGDGSDYSAFHILNLETMEIVAEYQGKLSPDIMAYLIANTGREYGNCMVVIENNNIGYAVLQDLEEMKYPNIYYSTKSSHEFVEQYEVEQKNNVVPGFSTTMKTRPLIIAKAEEFIRNKLVKIHSQRFINEMNTFIWENGKPIAMKSYHDDLIMSFAIMCWVKDVVLTTSLRDIDYKKAFINCFYTRIQKLDTTIVGMTGHEYPTVKELKRQYNNQDFSWMYDKPIIYKG